MTIPPRFQPRPFVRPDNSSTSPASSGAGGASATSPSTRRWPDRFQPDAATWGPPSRTLLNERLKNQLARDPALATPIIAAGQEAFGAYRAPQEPRISDSQPRPDGNFDITVSLVNRETGGVSAAANIVVDRNGRVVDNDVEGRPESIPVLPGEVDAQVRSSTARYLRDQVLPGSAGLQNGIINAAGFSPADPRLVNTSLGEVTPRADGNFEVTVRRELLLTGQSEERTVVVDSAGRVVPPTVPLHSLGGVQLR